MLRCPPFHIFRKQSHSHVRPHLILARTHADLVIGHPPQWRSPTPHQDQVIWVRGRICQLKAGVHEGVLGVLAGFAHELLCFNQPCRSLQGNTTLNVHSCHAMPASTRRRRSRRFVRSCSQAMRSMRALRTKYESPAALCCSALPKGNTMKNLGCAGSCCYRNAITIMDPENHNTMGTGM